MARIDINFIGPWRIFLGVRSVMIEAGTINEARDYVEKNFGPIFQDKLKARGINVVQSIWENSNILLNGKNISQLNNSVLKDGDRLDVISKVAGG